MNKGHQSLVLSMTKDTSPEEERVIAHPVRKQEGKTQHVKSDNSE
jgi:hypothetical protein